MTRPAVKQWEWMTEDEQIIHMMATHGYRDDYFSHEDGTTWSYDETLDLFRDAEARDQYHEEDHADVPYGGGVEHTHDAVHPTEVAQAIESIKRAVKK